MRLLTAALLLCAVPAFAADEDQPWGDRTPKPLSGNPGWNAAGLASAGVVLLNTAGGQHLVTPELGLQGALRLGPLATMRTLYTYSWRRDGATTVFVDNTYSTFTPRIDGTWGTDRAQFFAGVGPSLIVTTTRLHGPGENVRATELTAGFGYGLGLRWMVGKLPMAIDFGGQQRARRHDFRIGLAFGLPVCASERAP